MSFGIASALTVARKGSEQSPCAPHGERLHAVKPPTRVAAADVSSAASGYRCGVVSARVGPVVSVLVDAGSRTAPVSSYATASAAARAARDVR